MGPDPEGLIDPVRELGRPQRRVLLASRPEKGDDLLGELVGPPGPGPGREQPG